MQNVQFPCQNSVRRKIEAALQRIVQKGRNEDYGSCWKYCEKEKGPRKKEKKKRKEKKEKKENDPSNSLMQGPA